MAMARFIGIDTIVTERAAIMSSLKKRSCICTAISGDIQPRLMKWGTLNISRHSTRSCLGMSLVERASSFRFNSSSPSAMGEGTRRAGAAMLGRSDGAEGLMADSDTGLDETCLLPLGETDHNLPEDGIAVAGVACVP